jgi:hypothetical protein
VTISFDLDDTLIPGIKRFDTVRRSFFQKVCGFEPLRLGTVELIRALKSQGHRILVYTTSYRKARRIWWTFFSYGIRLDGIINQTRHERVLGEQSKDRSKYPPAFDIDIHIDDSQGVEIEGVRYDFKTIILTEDNPDWVAYVLQCISQATVK